MALERIAICSILSFSSNLYEEIEIYFSNGNTTKHIIQGACYNQFKFKYIFLI